jgi:glutamate decarboxylase
VLLRDLDRAWNELAAERPTARTEAKPDLWTAPERMAAHAKSRTTPLRPG